MKLSNIVVGKSRLLVAVAFCFLIVFGGCKKDKKNESPAEPELPPGQGTIATKAELLADSLFLYAKEVYLWNSDLPTYEVFNPRKYVSVDEEAGLSKELFEITRYARDNYEYKPSDPTDTKYSYIFDTDDTNPIAYLPARKSSVDLEGNGYDFGVWVGLYGNNTLYQVRILTVSKGSPADLAGIKRGDVITGINNRQFGSNYTSGDADYINTNLLGNQQTVTLTYKRGSGAAHTTTLSRASYKSNPVYCDSVYTAGQKKIGYIAFARFSNLSNAQSVLDKAFSRFSATAVTDLIVDLRYNGGDMSVLQSIWPTLSHPPR
ncbi:S41 family peptidase [Arcticibacter sp. MXS-1]|uniref:S41 family peptidase n=1 Tax=Arcticibacter sp. MXS-1 TaxID=3341726 RepID=UPI0035A841B5